MRPFLLQVAGLMLPLLIASAAAYAGVGVFERAVGFLGLDMAVTPTAYAVTALIAASNPMMAIFAAFMVPVSSRH